MLSFRTSPDATGKLLFAAWRTRFSDAVRASDFEGVQQTAAARTSQRVSPMSRSKESGSSRSCRTARASRRRSIKREIRDCSEKPRFAWSVNFCLRNSENEQLSPSFRSATNDQNASVLCIDCTPFSQNGQKIPTMRCYAAFRIWMLRSMRPRRAFLRITSALDSAISRG